MKEALAAILFFLIFIGLIIATSSKPPDDAVSKTLCANITCYYEIKDKK